MRTHITPVQLFFLIFAYLLSGFFLYNIHSYYAVAAQFAVFSLFAVLGTGGLFRRRRGLADFISFYVSRPFKLVFLGLFLILSVFQMGRTIIFYSESIERYCDFLPSWMILFAIGFCAVLTVRQGMTAIGRLAELIPFILVPLVFVRPFGDFAPVLAASDFPASGVLSCVSSAPVFFLASKTVTSGDDGISSSMRVASTPPASRAFYLLRIMIAAAASASLVYVFLSLFSFHADDVFLSLFLWMLHILRLSVLIGICVDLIAENRHAGYRTVYTGIFSVSVMMALAELQGSKWIFLYQIDRVIAITELILPVAFNLIFAIRFWLFGRNRFRVRKKRGSV